MPNYFAFINMFSIKLIAFHGCIIAMAAVTSNDDHGIEGGVTTLSGNELQKAVTVLENSLTKLAAGDGPNYKISKVYSATSQIVSGRLHTYNVDLIDVNNAVKKCKISIWSQVWLPDGIEVTFECEGEQKLVKRHSP